MANAVVKYEIPAVPAHLMNRVINTSFLTGLPQGGGFPSIGISGTRFVRKEDGESFPINTMEIQVILITAKPNLDKTFYAGKYDPNSTEIKSPDCQSRDGIRPTADSPLKQCESCAGCPQNQWGSGLDASGNPGKGKACKDAKTLAIFANNAVYGFKVPPASLKAFAHYVKETSRRGVDLSTAITVIGFDPQFSYPVLTFGFGGFLAAEQVAKIDALKDSQEVSDIVGGGDATQVAPVQIAVKPVVQVVADPFASAPVEAVADPFAAPAVEKPKAVRAAKAKPVEVAAPPAEDDDLAALAAELGVDL